MAIFLTWLASGILAFGESMGETVCVYNYMKSLQYHNFQQCDDAGVLGSYLRLKHGSRWFRKPIIWNSETCSSAVILNITGLRLLQITNCDDAAVHLHRSYGIV